MTELANRTNRTFSPLLATPTTRDVEYAALGQVTGGAEHYQRVNLSDMSPLLMDRPDQIAPGPGRASSPAGDPLISPERAAGGVASEDGSGAGRKSLLLTRLRNT